MSWRNINVLNQFIMVTMNEWAIFPSFITFTMFLIFRVWIFRKYNNIYEKQIFLFFSGAVDLTRWAMHAEYRWQPAHGPHHAFRSRRWFLLCAIMVFFVAQAVCAGGKTRALFDHFSSQNWSVCENVVYNCCKWWVFVVLSFTRYKVHV